MNNRLLTSTVLFIAIIGCTTPQKGHRIFIGDWWDYYLRGVDYIEENDWDNAEKDLRETLRYRTKDTYRARTYGVHFIEYFPHRELGVILFNKDQFEEAKKELTLSLDSQPTAKAKYYLNKVHEKIVLKSRDDLEIPKIIVENPKSGFITNQFKTQVSLKVSDNNFVQAIRINNKDEYMELFKPEINVKRDVDLTEGENEIEIDAIDIAGNKNSINIPIIVDRIGPQLTLYGCIIKGNEITISGNISDDSGIKSFMLSDTSIAGKTDFDFQTTLKLPAGQKSVDFYAEDVVGNIHKGTINIEELQKIKIGSLEKVFPSHLASAGPIPFNSLLYGAIEEPVLELKNVVDGETIYLESLFLEGSVSSSDPITELLVNDKPIKCKQGLRIFFNAKFKLEPGENKVILSASTDRGVKVQKVYKVIYKVPEVHQISHRLTLSVLPLEKKGESGICSEIADNEILAAFTNTNRFNLLEREHMEKILFEQKLGTSAIADPGTAARLGKLMASEFMLYGYILESSGSVTVRTFVVDVETSKILQSEDVYEEDKSIKAFQKILDLLAWKFMKAFPLMEGIVINVKGDTVFLDLGKEQGILPDRKVIIFREEEVVHPVTGAVLGSDAVELAQGKIISSESAFSKAEIAKLIEDAKIEKLDKFITK